MDFPATHAGFNSQNQVIFKTVGAFSHPDHPSISLNILSTAASFHSFNWKKKKKWKYSKELMPQSYPLPSYTMQ